MTTGLAQSTSTTRSCLNLADPCRFHSRSGGRAIVKAVAPGIFGPCASVAAAEGRRADRARLHDEPRLPPQDAQQAHQRFLPRSPGARRGQRCASHRSPQTHRAATTACASHATPLTPALQPSPSLPPSQPKVQQTGESSNPPTINASIFGHQPNAHPEFVAIDPKFTDLGWDNWFGELCLAFACVDEHGRRHELMLLRWLWASTETLVRDERSGGYREVPYRTRYGLQNKYEVMSVDTAMHRAPVFRPPRFAEPEREVRSEPHTYGRRICTVSFRCCVHDVVRLMYMMYPVCNVGQ